MCPSSSQSQRDYIPGLFGGGFESHEFWLDEGTNPTFV
jgi:hypothetical protein